MFFCCIIQSGNVECAKTTCPKLDGCYMIIYDNFNQDRSCSCDMCKGKSCANYS